MHCRYNFSAGPTALPQPVREIMRDELLNWQETGMSFMELSHRSDEFKSMAQASERDLRELLDIPDNYSVLFLQGGARLQFSAIPMNLLEKLNTTAVYINSGVWSEQAIDEGKRYANVCLATQVQDINYQVIPDPSTWQLPEQAAYFYYADNETVNGLEFPDIPKTDFPLICDMSSSLLSKPIDVSRFGLIFACAQKNIGIAGLTVVIIRNDLLDRIPLAETPITMQYLKQKQASSLLNTPPMFAWYVSGLIFQWMKREGGVVALAAVNQKKAEKLYRFIDDSDFYHNTVAKPYRSRMNVIFTLSNDALTADFLLQAKAQGLFNLQGHVSLGGVRASIYNAMPESGIDTLIQYMDAFVAQSAMKNKKSISA